MLGLLEKLRQDIFARYFVASAIALAIDTTSFLTLVAAGAAAGVAAALGYCIGIVAHWLITSRAVFAAAVAERGPARTRQKLLFVLSALAGLFLTTAIVSVGSALAVSLLLTKGVAVAASFTVTWLIRRWVVFRPSAVVA